MIFNCYSLHVSYLPHPNSGMQLSRKVWGSYYTLDCKVDKKPPIYRRGEKGCGLYSRREIKRGGKVRSLSFYGKPGDWLDKMVVEHSTVVTFDL